MARDRFEMLFTHNVDGVFFMTLDEPIRWDASADQEALLDYVYEHLRLTEINPRMCEQLGAPREQLLGTVPRDRWFGDTVSWRARMRQLYDYGHTYLTIRAPKSDGGWYDVEGEYVCIYDDDGRITGHFGTQRDVTVQRKTAERLQLAMASGDIGVWDLDLMLNAICFDQAWIARLGYDPSSPQCQSAVWWASLIHRSDFEQVTAAFVEHLEGKLPTYRIEHRLRAASGDWVWVLSTGRVSARGADGKPLRIVGTTVDITERKLLQERVFLSERMASLGTLAAGVGHEINNPLTYIALNLTLLERELKALALPEDAHGRMRSMIEAARYGTERVTKIVRDLQALARVPDHGITQVDIGIVLERCLELADHQIRRRAWVIRELAPIPSVRGHEGRLMQLFLNLLVNAAQAIPEGAIDRHWIRVTTHSDGAHAVIAIADNGAGIAPELLGRIFDPFFTTKEVGEGSGLGLAICRSIVASMAGDIEVASTPGEGTTFRVLLPIATRKSVLVIDDEPMIAQLVSRVLADHQVVAETCARTALDRLRAGERFDRILCDLMMPDVSGIQFYEELAAIDPVLRDRVVFLSGGVFTEQVRSFLDRVPNRRLDKPFDVEALTAAIAD